ncbi:dCMP deaminase [Streptomyces sp. NBC_01232]|uniref:dCMP deaminase n=1 Tax=Streptomyces sp. NBC_01232 TaxID=2903786 RepID=UPI003FA38C4F
MNSVNRPIELSRKCPPAEGAFSVGVIIVSSDSEDLADGNSRETDAHVHAEESALAKLPGNDPRLASATLCSTLEPCPERKSRPRTCTQLILRSPIRRVVIAWREPSLLVAHCVGVETLRAEGIEVVELSSLGDQARVENAHLLR